MDRTIRPKNKRKQQPAKDMNWSGGWACTSHPGVLGSIPKREEPGKTGRHPVLKYRVPHRYQRLVCPFVCVRTASFPCRFSDLGLNFLLASAYCTRAHTLSLDSYSRPTTGKSSSPAGLSSIRSTLVYEYVVDCASASPYTYSSSTHRFPDDRTHMRSPVCGGQTSPHKPRLVVS
jgi:hypothetical protein